MKSREEQRAAVGSYEKRGSMASSWEEKGKTRGEGPEQKGRRTDTCPSCKEKAVARGCSSVPKNAFRGLRFPLGRGRHYAFT